MPTYKNRPAMALDTVLRRHMTLDGLAQTLAKQKLRLTRLDRFPDPYEGSVPKQQIDDQLPIFSSRNVFFEGGMNPGTPEQLDPWTEMSLWRRAMTRSAHASCWSAGHESEAMWRLYCRDSGVEGQGVAIESTLAAIEASVDAQGLLVSPIAYRYYHTGPAFTDELDSFMNKRMGFSHEGEVRLLSFNKDQYLSIANAVRAQAPAPADLPEYVHLAWPVHAVVNRLLISPYADEAYEKRVRDQVAAIDSSLASKLELSVLSERRYAANF
jgi:hypothetical protein